MRNSELIRTPGNVFVSVEAPQTAAHAAISADWKSIAHEMTEEAAAPKQSAPVSTPEPPKMPSGLHQNDRFLTGIKATLKISGKWLPAPVVFSQYYDKYNLVELRDIEIGLDILAKADEIQSNVVEGKNQYVLPTSDFETLLDRCQMSKYHLAEITMIDEAVMCDYCKGTKISTDRRTQ